MPDAPSILQFKSVSCRRSITRTEPSQIEDVTFDLPEASFTLLCGGEHCGKNLLLRLAGLLEAIDSGRILLQGNDVSKLDEAERSLLRSHVFGYILSLPYLLPSLSTLENAAMPMFKLGTDSSEQSLQQTVEVLRHFDLLEAADDPAGDLSLCDQFNLAVARAVLHRPKLLIVEQPSPSLGADLQIRHLHRIAAYARIHGMTVLAAGNPLIFEGIPDRQIELENGKVVACRPCHVQNVGSTNEPHR